MADFNNRRQRRPEDMSLDELLRTTKEEIRDREPDSFQPTLPAEYEDLVSEEELNQFYEEEPEDRYRVPTAVKVLLYICCVLTASILLAVFAWKCADEVCALTAEDRVVTVTVPENATMAQITDMLHEKELIEYPWLFNLYCMVSNAAEKIDPGTYDLNAVFDYHALVYCMIETSENRATVEVTIPEGYEAEDIFQLLEENGVATTAELKDAAANYEFDYWFLEGLDYGDHRRLEGYLFPDTYEFYVDDDPANALGRFLRNFDNKFTEEMQADLDRLNADLRSRKLAAGFAEAEIQDLTLREIIIVASLVEKETSGTAESGKIASVIYNRLCSKLYPCLNIDATIQYVLPERKEILTNADKAVISPYNTYTNVGLPIGPIANPGISSIRAALYPVDTDYYFYALDPIAGGHHFSEDVYEHQAFLDSLVGDTPQTSITEEQAIEFALEEAKNEKYQYQGWESDFSYAPIAKLISSEADMQDALWEPDWAASDADGNALYTGQPVWRVQLSDVNDALTHLLLYVDAETGQIVGAGKLSD